MRVHVCMWRVATGGGVAGWIQEGHASGPDVGYVKFKRGEGQKKVDVAQTEAR